MMTNTQPRTGNARRLQYDGSIAISVGRSRKDMKWKPKELLWSEFTASQLTPTRTRETVAQYQKMSKAKQGEIKDVGGFVGGTLKGGRRKADAVAWRSLITLDIDYGRADTWTQIKMIYDWAALIYSTHSHTPEKPRYRLILPLIRPISPAEYGAVSRRIAEMIGIDDFDDSTYEPSRLMYNASCPADGDFFADVQDGPWIDPDEILATYDDWQDVTQWPESSRSESIRQKTKEKAGDPLTKTGVIGAFNRAYTIPEAIDNFLGDIYTPTDTPNRYTYAQGSTVGGLVVYDGGTFAFSHHGTDPLSGILVNAYDMVRLHLFGDADEDAKPETPVTRLPSTLKMQEMILKDANVKRELAKERDQAIAEDFGSDASGDEDDWYKNLEFNAKGRLIQSIDNAVVILEGDPLLKNAIRYDTFAERFEICADLPWTKDRRAWSDMDDAALQHYMEHYRDFTSAPKLETALQVVLLRRKFHPVREYLDALKWDGVPRVDTLLDDYLGVEKMNPYVRAVTRKALVAAVKRIYQPGAKFDYVLTLIGKQGIGKSSILRQLAGKWLQETMPTMEGKEASEQLRGYWIVELGELGFMRKSEIETVKGFITRTVDAYRVPYSKRLSEFPRQCIFVANTNEDTFINDATGGRRWWCVRVTGNPRKEGGWQSLTPEIADQIWAEAVALYRAGEKVYLDTPELEQSAQKEQKRARKESEKMGPVIEYLDTLLPENWDGMDLYQRHSFLDGDVQAPPGTVQRTRVCIAEIWEECFRQAPNSMRRQDADELHQIMSMVDGWVKNPKKLRVKGKGVQRVYERECR